MVLIFICLLILSVGTYFIWFSRYNIPAHLEAAFLFTRYVVPLFLVDTVANFDANTLDLYKEILLIGSICYLTGLIIGNNIPLIKLKYFTWQVLDENAYNDRVIKITKLLFWVGVGGILISYAIMGFIPMFASEPLNAKFFRGQYQAPYLRAAVIFRIANYILYSLPPIFLIMWYYYKRKIYLLYLFIVIALIATTLTRGNILYGALAAVGVICAYKKQLFKYYMVALILIFSLGSISFYLVGLLLHNDALIGMYDRDNIFETIALGSPDITDHLTFLKAFELNPIYTYGRTFFGGLIPGHYQWNPSVWALSITNPKDDVNDITSGGLRLPLPLWGYVSFSWVGVIILSLISGLLNGYLTKAIKKLVKEAKNIIVIMIVLLVYINIYGQIVTFYTISMYEIPVMIFMCFYMFRFQVK